MKKIINDPNAVVTDSLRGFAAAHSDLVDVFYNPDYVVRKQAPPPSKVAVVSGGGSGHEPLHAGFVGYGMLDAAVPGAVFTSPTPDAILAATQAVSTEAGVLHLVKNYTGDVLNFETAAELAGAEGTSVSAVVIDDDVAVQDSSFTAGRRGVGGTVLIEKIVGAAAERGDSLEDVTQLASDLNASVRSMGLALTPATVPHAGKPTFELAADELEIGIGIHGEPGRERITIEKADTLVPRLLDPIVEDLPFESGDDVLLFVNGMGGTPLLELYLAYDIAQKALGEKGIRVSRSLVGNYITSLEMQGISVSVLRMTPDTTQLWDKPVHTAAWRAGV